MNVLRVLLTNVTLATRSGTELFTRDLAIGLARRGHRPVVYTPDPGVVAEEIRAAGIAVTADLAEVAEEPDVIHGHHTLPLMAALEWFSGRPALFVVHDRRQWTDAPPLHPRILRYVAVDEHCRERLAEAGLPQNATAVVYNAVDLSRFRPRPPLPPKASRALLFSNYVTEADVAGVARQACAALGITLDVAGSRLGAAQARPQDVLPTYDLVFGKARCALEAMAVGCAVVVCDVAGVGGLVTPENFDALRRLNFGRCTLAEPVTVEALTRAILRYDATACDAVARRARREADLELQVGRFEELYREMLSAPPAAGDRLTEARAVARWLPTLLPPWQDWAAVLAERERLCCELEEARRSVADLAVTASKLQEQGAVAAESATRDVADARVECEAHRVRAGRLGAEAAALADELAWMRESATWRLRLRILRLPGVAAVAGARGRRRNARRSAVLPMPVIVGVPRSGTTLLRMMLDAHSELAIPPETGFLAEAAHRRSESWTPDGVATLIHSSRAWPDFHLEESGLRRELLRCRPFALDAGLRAFYRLYARRFRKARWGDKTPDYGRHMQAIAGVLPEACFIHLLRDGRDVAASVRALWFSPGADLATIAQDWLERIEATRRQAVGLQYLEVRYEDLVDNPEAVLRRVCDFVALRFEPRMLDYHRQAAARLAEHEASFDSEGRLVIDKPARLSQQYWATQPPAPSRIGRWRRDLSSQECAEFEAAAGPLLRQLGYSA